MLTNILAVLSVVVMTNVFPPKQYWHESHMTYCDTGAYSSGPDGSWQDYPANQWGGFIWPAKATKERDNPDVRVTEVREVKTLSFEFDSVHYSLEYANEVLSSNREVRITTSSTTQTNSGTVTTIVERWLDEKKAAELGGRR